MKPNSRCAKKNPLCPQSSIEVETCVGAVFMLMVENNVTGDEVVDEFSSDNDPKHLTKDTNKWLRKKNIIVIVIR